MDCRTPGFLPFTVSWSLIQLMSIESVMPSNRLIRDTIFGIWICKLAPDIGMSPCKGMWGMPLHGRGAPHFGSCQHCGYGQSLHVIGTKARRWLAYWCTCGPSNSGLHQWAHSRPRCPESSGCPSLCWSIALFPGASIFSLPTQPFLFHMESLVLSGQMMTLFLLAFHLSIHDVWPLLLVLLPMMS